MGYAPLVDLHQGMQSSIFYSLGLLSELSPNHEII
jgi:hypothetical protein